MLLYGICDCWHDVVNICAVSDARIDGLMEYMAKKCNETDFPFCYALGSNEVRWYHPFDEVFIDYDDIYYTDDYGDEHFVRDECYLDESHFRQLFINEFSEFVQSQVRILPHLR